MAKIPASAAAFALVSLVACGPKGPGSDQAAVRSVRSVRSPASTALQARLEAAAGRVCPGRPEASAQTSKDAQRFYHEHDYRLMWSDQQRARPIVRAMAASLRAAGKDGLDPADYGADEIEGYAEQELDDAKAIELDVMATCRFLRYGWELAHGVSNPEAIDPHWKRAPWRADLQQALQHGVAGGQIAAALDRLAPASPQYGGLKHQLERYRAMPHDPAVDARIERIVLNMERWRWMPADLGSRYLLVNIPAFRLDVIESGRSVLGMNVVVGKKRSRTPVLADEMTTIVFSPYWNIPPEIARNETIPQALDDPSYLDRMNIEVIRAGGAPVDLAEIDPDEVKSGGLRFRQRPGAGNSLGQVKFVFPNHFNVYLHDTPSKSFFARVERDFSHGCVRVEHARDLARYVLRDQPEWSDDRIDAAMRAGTERSVALKQPLPVYLTYFTAWEDNGDIRIGNDIYGYDAKQAASGL